MPKRWSVGNLKKLLLQLPVSERQAILDHANLRSVDGKNGTKDVKKPLLGNSNISYQTLQPTSSSKTLRHGDCFEYDEVPTSKKGSAEKPPQIPINNYPSYDVNDGGLPDNTTLEIFSLKRQNAALGAKLVGANNKLTTALETLFSERRFLKLWIDEGQAPESWDELSARIRRLEGTIAHLEDRTLYPSDEIKLPDRWKKKS